MRRFGLPSASWPSGSPLPLFGTHRFGDCRWAGWPSGSLLPFFGTHRFGVAAGRVRSSTFRFGNCPRRVGLRVHRFRFSARTALELPSASWPSGSRLPLFGMHRFGVALGGLVLPLGGLAFGLTASAFRHVPLRSGRWASWFFRLPLRSGRWASWFFRSAGWPSGSLLPLFGTHRFGVALGGLVLPLVGLVFPPSASEIALGGLAFGLIASEIAIWRVGLWAHRFGNSARRVGLRAHCFRFSARTASEWPPGGLAFGLTASAFRHAPLRRLPFGGLAFGLPLRRLPSAGWPSGSLLPLFGMRRSAPPRRRSEDRRSTTTRQLFHFKTLIPTC